MVYRPAPHWVHEAAPAKEYKPGLQKLEAAVKPVEAQYRPAPHAPQALWPVSAEKRPIVQLEQALAPANEYWPARQSPVAADEPVAAQKLPARQLKQKDAPVEGINVPIAHEKQKVALTAELYVPSGQSIQEEEDEEPAIDK